MKLTKRIMCAVLCLTILLSGTVFAINTSAAYTALSLLDRDSSWGNYSFYSYASRSDCETGVSKEYDLQNNTKGVMSSRKTPFASGKVIQLSGSAWTLGDGDELGSGSLWTLLFDVYFTSTTNAYVKIPLAGDKKILIQNGKVLTGSSTTYNVEFEANKWYRIDIRISQVKSFTADSDVSINVNGTCVAKDTVPTFNFYKGTSTTSGFDIVGDKAYLDNVVNDCIGKQSFSYYNEETNKWTGYKSNGATAQCVVTKSTTPTTTTMASYSVSYNANGGSNAPASQTAQNGSVTVTSSTPTAPNACSTFSKWNTQSNGNGTTYYAGNSISLSANTTLYAIWNVNHTPTTDAAVPATCISTGLTEGSHCSVCGTTIVAQTSVKKADHTWNTGVITTDSTCALEGVKTFTCTVVGCGATKTEAIAKKAHTPVTDAAVAPMCEQTGLTEGSHCSVCQTVIVAQQVVAAKNHTPVTDAAVAPGCVTPGYTEGSHCADCKKVLVAQIEIEPLQHNYVDGFCAKCGEPDPDSFTQGDIDGNGTLEANDLVRLLKYVVGQDVEVLEKALDVNRDGAVNAKDLSRLASLLAD